MTRFDLNEVSFFGAEGESLSPALLESIEMEPSRFNVLVTHADLAAKAVTEDSTSDCCGTSP